MLIKRFKSLLRGERAIETIEVVVIIVIIIAIGFALRNVLLSWYNLLIEGANDRVFQGDSTTPFAG